MITGIHLCQSFPLCLEAGEGRGKEETFDSMYDKMFLNKLLSYREI